jgi:hypothetical protein
MGAKIEEMAAGIENVFQEAFAALLARRDTAYAAEIAPLDAEKESLLKEHAAIGEAARNLEKVLAAKAREAQREADALLVAGKVGEAELKIKEAEEAANAPAAMRMNRGETSARIAEIDSEKQAIARRIFASWYADCQAMIRPAEHGLFVVFLDGLRESFAAFQTATATGPDSWGRTPGLFNQSHIAGLIAHEQSAEWQAGRRWYAGRVG